MIFCVSNAVKNIYPKAKEEKKGLKIPDANFSSKSIL
jgi:hypothetical protein